MQTIGIPLIQTILDSAIALGALGLVFYSAKRGIDALMLWIRLNSPAEPPPVSSDGYRDAADTKVIAKRARQEPTLNDYASARSQSLN